MYAAGQELKLERNPIYSGSLTGAKLQESVRTVSVVRHLDGGRIGIQFKGSKVWYSTYLNSEWIQSKNMKYRNLDFITEGNK
jgi:hypothetical protein